MKAKICTNLDTIPEGRYTFTENFVKLPDGTILIENTSAVMVEPTRAQMKDLKLQRDLFAVNLGIMYLSLIALIIGSRMRRRKKS